jgi:hypothetical protein
MGDRGAKVALFDGFARVGRALASGRRIELQVLRRAGLVVAVGMYETHPSAARA